MILTSVKNCRLHMYDEARPLVIRGSGRTAVHNTPTKPSKWQNCKTPLDVEAHRQKYAGLSLKRFGLGSLIHCPRCTRSSGFRAQFRSSACHLQSRRQRRSSPPESVQSTAKQRNKQLAKQQKPPVPRSALHIPSSHNRINSTERLRVDETQIYSGRSAARYTNFFGEKIFDVIELELAPQINPTVSGR